jgi:hypothetical protein
MHTTTRETLVKIVLSPENKVIFELDVWEVTLLHQVITPVANPWHDLYARALQKAQTQGVWKLTKVEDGR